MKIRTASHHPSRRCLCFALALFALLLPLLPACRSTRPAPSLYDDPANWAIFALGGLDKPADVFLVAPTVDLRPEDNMSLSDGSTKTKFLRALLFQHGIYTPSARLFAPYYSQAAMRVYSLPAPLREPALQRAYRDVAEAFRWYLLHENRGRPVVLAGFSQGADLCLRLLADAFSDPSLQSRLVAVYAIGWPCPPSNLPHVRPAASAADTGVVVSFDCEHPDVASTFIYPSYAPAPSACINPLTWSTSPDPAPADLNLGACFPDSSGAVEREIPAFCGARIDPSRGVLKVLGPDPADHPPLVPGLPPGAYHVYDCMFFYRNLQQNVSARIQAFLAASPR